jgi:hypothetical protein
LNGDEKSMFSMLTKFKVSNFKNVEDLPLTFQRNFFEVGKNIYFKLKTFDFLDPTNFKLSQMEIE